MESRGEGEQDEEIIVEKEVRILCPPANFQNLCVKNGVLI